MQVILGISLGTQSIGFAVLHNGELVDWHIRSFRGKWNKKKLISILHVFSNQVSKHRVSMVALKIPDAFNHSKGYAQLMGALNVFLEDLPVKVSYYTLPELKQLLCTTKGINKAALAAHIVNLYPDLYLHHKKENTYRKGYYNKIFEAVAAARCMSNPQ